MRLRSSVPSTTLRAGFGRRSSSRGSASATNARRGRPAAGSVSLAFARLGLGWQAARVLSAHGRPVQGILAAAQRSQHFAVLTDESNTPQVVAAALRSAGIGDAPVHVFERLGGQG